MDRSTALIKNLKVERERWKESVKTFGDKRDKLVGEVLLAAAFIVYGGLYDQKGREILLKTWRNKLKESGIPFDETLTMSSYLTTSKKLYTGQVVGWLMIILILKILHYWNGVKILL